MKTAIVLSGGGARGDFQLGALTALEEMGIRPDIVCGTSVGALNALMLTQGDGGLEELRRIWLGLRRNDHMWQFEDWWGEIHPSIREMVMSMVNGEQGAASTELWSVRSSLLLGGGIGTVAFGPVGFLAGALAGAGVSGAIQNISADALRDVFVVLGTRARAVFNLNPVRALMATHFDRNRFAKWVSSGKKLRLATVGLGTGKLAYVTEKGELLFRGSSEPVPSDIDILQAAIASSAIAAVFPPVEFAGDAWVDGGHRENVPLQAALDAQADRVYAICASPIDPVSSVNRTEDPEKAPKNYASERILSIAERALLEIHLDELAATDVYPVVAHSGVPVTVIAPRFPTHDIVTIDAELIRANYNYGYRQAYDTVQGEQAALAAASDTIAVNDGKVGRYRRKVWNGIGVPLSSEVASLRAAAAQKKSDRAAAGLRNDAPQVHEALPQGDELVPGDKMLPGQALVSPDGRFRFIYQTDGNLVLYREDPGHSVPLWATATDGRPLGVVVLQRDGNLVMYDEEMSALWASGSNVEQDPRLRVQADGNVVIYKGQRVIWSTKTSQLGANTGVTVTPVVRSFTLINGSPSTIAARYFKVDDWLMALALPGGEFTLAPAASAGWAFPSDVDQVKIRINNRHELLAVPGQVVTFTTDDRLAIVNDTPRAIDVAIFHDQDILRVVALPGGLFGVEPGATSFWEFPMDIERAVLLINHRLIQTVRRGSQITFEHESRVFVTNESAAPVTARFYRTDDTWRWVALAGGDQTVQIGGTIEFEVPNELSAVQVIVAGVGATANPGDRLAFTSGRNVVLR